MPQGESATASGTGKYLNNQNYFRKISVCIVSILVAIEIYFFFEYGFLTTRHNETNLFFYILNNASDPTVLYSYFNNGLLFTLYSLSFICPIYISIFGNLIVNGFITTCLVILNYTFYSEITRIKSGASVLWIDALTIVSMLFSLVMICLLCMTLLYNLLYIINKINEKPVAAK
jgi:hypothetical protein